MQFKKTLFETTLSIVSKVHSLHFAVYTFEAVVKTTKTVESKRELEFNLNSSHSVDFINADPHQHYEEIAQC